MFVLPSSTYIHIMYTNIIVRQAVVIIATDLQRVHNRLTFPYLTPVDHSAQEWSRYVSDTPIEAAQNGRSEINMTMFIYLARQLVNIFSSLGRTDGGIFKEIEVV